MKKTITIAAVAFILGVILTVFTFQTYTIYEYRTKTDQNTAGIQQIVTFINQSLQANQQAQNASIQAQTQPVAPPKK